MWLYSPLFWLFMAASALACLLGILRKAWTRPTAALAGFAVLFALAWFTHPFNGELGRFRAGTNELLKGQTVSAPDFEWPFERYRFVIPGAKLVPRLPAQPAGAADAESLFKTSRYALVQRRIGQIPCTDCRILDERWDLLAQPDRTDGAMAAFKTPETYWFSKEYLVEPLAP